MNVTFYCFNYYSLYVSYVYTLELKNKYNAKCNLIWRNLIFELPDEAYKVWGSVNYLNLKKMKSQTGYKLFNRMKLDSKYIYNEIIKKNQMNSTLCDSDILFVFKDDNIYDNAVIDYYKENTNKAIVLIEEGTALYMNNRKEVNNYKKLLKKKIYSVIGLPREIFKNQGESHKIDIIICRNPKLLPQHKKEGKKILKQSNLFTEKYTNKFSKDIFNIDVNSNRKIDIVYISQPLSEVGLIYETEERKAILTIMEKIETKYNVGIKLHPRENKEKYNSILKKYRNVSLLSDEIQKLPAEMMFYIYKKPKLISPFSSTIFNIKKIDDQADLSLTYKLFNLSKDIENDLDNIYVDFNVDIVSWNSGKIKINSKTVESKETNNDVNFQEIKIILDELIQRTYI